MVRALLNDHSWSLGVYYEYVICIWPSAQVDVTMF